VLIVHPPEEETMITFEVNDMTCGHCVSAITQAVKRADAGARIAIDLATKRVDIEAVAADEAALKAAIEDAGYTPVPVAGATTAPRGSGGGCCGCGR
jgi:copper chaperone